MFESKITARRTLVVLRVFVVFLGLFLILIGCTSTPDETALPTLAVLPSVTSQQQSASVNVADIATSVPPDAIPVVQQATQPPATPVPLVTELPRVVATTEPIAVDVPQQPVLNQVVINFHPSTTLEQRTAYIQQIGGTISQAIDALDTVVVTVSQEIATQPLPESPVVAASEPDYYVVAFQEEVVDDPLYPQQWALPVIGAPYAWAETPADAPTVTVAVIDSGICLEHPDLAGRILPGFDFVEDDDTPQDDFGHGCGVSGIIAANTNNQIGMAGVAPNAMVMPLRVLDAYGIGTYSDVAAAIVYAADNGAEIINLSLGGANPSTVLENAVNYADTYGVMVIGAAGNTGQASVLYPAAYDSVIAVGSVDFDLQQSSFSNYGPQIDLWAPGRDILTTTNANGYATMSGTSFAAPYVAGVVAFGTTRGAEIALDGAIVGIDPSDSSVFPILPPSLPDTLEESPSPDQTLQPLGFFDEMGGVFLPDDRQQILDTGTNPNRMVARLLVQFPSGSNAACTGWFAGPNLILTAGHCVYNNTLTHGEWADRVDILVAVPDVHWWGDEGILTAFGGCGSVGQTQCDDLLKPICYNPTIIDSDRECDYGGIVLDDSVGDFFGWFVPGYMPDSDLLNQQLTITGYPQEVRGNVTAADIGTMWESLGIISAIPETGIIYHRIDTGPGFSGGPLWFPTGEAGLYYAMGNVHGGGLECSLGLNLYNCDVRYNQNIVQELRNWGAETTHRICHRLTISYAGDAEHLLTYPGNNCAEGQDYYQVGTEVTIQVEDRSPDYSVVWNGSSDDTIITNINTVTMSSNKPVIVTYQEIPDTVYTITGSVTGGSTGGVLISNGDQVTYTLSSGSFTLYVPDDGWHTITASKQGYSMSPSSKNVYIGASGTVDAGQFLATPISSGNCPRECIFYPEVDTTISMEHSTTSYGTDSQLWVGSNQYGSTGASQTDRGMLRFDLSSIADASVYEVELHMYINDYGDDRSTISLHRIRDSWSENITYKQWNDSGNGTYSLLSTNETISNTGWVIWTDTSLKSLVEDWVDGSVANNGIMVIPTDYTDWVKHGWVSREGSSAYRPMLVVRILDESQSADLIVSEPQPLTTNEPFPVGQSIQWRVVSTNLGAGDAVRHDVGYYLGSSPNDYSNRLGDDSIGPVFAGESVDDNDFEYVFNTPGIYYLNVFVDDDNGSGSPGDVNEINEGNNKNSYGPFEVYVPNQAPLWSPLLSDKTLDEDTSLDNAIDLWNHVEDEDAGAALTFVIVNDPNPMAGVRIDSNRYIDINPVLNWHGYVDVDVKVYDTEGAHSTDTFRVTVNPVNDQPWISPVVPDQAVVVDQNIVFDLSTYEHDVEDSGTALDWSVTGLDNATVSGQYSGDNVLTFTPFTDFEGDDMVTLHLEDSDGGEVTQDVTLTWGICRAVTEISEIECKTLEALYNSTDGDNWDDNTGWLATNTPCSWYGVVCGGGHVTELDLWNNQLSGAIPPELGNLSNLQHLSLGSNQLSGAIPPELGNLSNLQELALGFNQLSGEIPPQLGNLSNLQELVLYHNQLSEAIPPELSNLSNLQKLALSTNQLSGEIPPQLGSLSNLQELWLHNNQLSGEIPPQLGNLSNLQNLVLYNNRLSGEIPPQLGSLSSLETLGLYLNQLSGAIPPELGNLSSLQWLYLGDNQLSGEIPPELGNLSNLQRLYLENNQLGGPIPTLITNLVNLDGSWTDIGYNALYSTNAAVNTFLSTKDPDWDQTQTVFPANVQVVNVTSNSMDLSWSTIPYTGDGGYYEVLSSTTPSGPYGQPGCTTNDKTETGCIVTGLLSDTVYYFVVRTFTPAHGDQQNDLWSEYSAEVFGETPSFCDGVSQIPQLECSALEALYNSTDGDNWDNNSGWLDTNTPCNWYGMVCSGGHVTELDLDNNQLSGAIPPELGNLSNLQELRLYTNRLSGSIPPELGNLSNLWWLLLGGNQLSGAIPPELGNLSNLQQLHLGNNQFSGEIPPELGNLSNLQRLYLYDNQLSGTIPPELGNLFNLQRLYLYDNQLSGTIPPELGNLSNLWWLYLYDNQLSGAIPPELGNLSNLQRLSLYDNQLSGAIPPELGNLSNLWWLLLGDNQLSGAIPPELGNLSNLQALELYNNQLSGPIPPELGNLSNLQDLRLYNNQLSGAIPPELGNLSNLEWLDLHDNQLSGAIPPELGNLSILWALYLNNNLLSGAIPPELGNLFSLSELYLNNNQLSGAIPPELGNLSILWALYLDNNQLSGAIPPELGNLFSLSELYLHNNQLSGAIPLELGNLPNLFMLDLHNNQLSGAVPDITGLIGLSLDIGYNALYASGDVETFLNFIDPDWADTQTVAPDNVAAATASTTNIDLTWDIINYTGDSGYYEVSYGTTPGGPYPTSVNTTDKTATGHTVIGLAPGMDYYFVVRTFTPNHGSQQNDLWSEYTDEVSAQTAISAACVGVTEIPQVECGALEALYNSTNGVGWVDNSGWLTTNTPCNWYGVVCNGGHVIRLYLQNNQLSGVIPPELGSLSNLDWLSLGTNQLSGVIPPELGNLSNLQSFGLGENQLSGVIPPELGSLSSLQSLWLETNQLSGPIPPELGNLSNLDWLGMAANQLSGPIPPELGNLSNLQELDLNNNQLSGPIPLELGNLSSLQWLGLAGNQLSGPIPPELGNLPNLTGLLLGVNQLNGPIPPEIGDLSNLQELRLEVNQLSGPIPPQLGDLTNLQWLYLNDNQLSGAVPDITGLTGLIDTDIGYNALYASGAVETFLNAEDPNWADTQTVAPDNVTVTTALSTSIDLTWDAINYTWDGGYYEISYSTTLGGLYTVHGITADKTVTSYTVDGLSADTIYYLVVRTFTPVHGDQQNALWSEYSQETTGDNRIDAPENLVATPVSSSQINLTWTHNTRHENRFLVEHSLDGVAWAQIGQVDISQTSYQHSNLTCDGTIHHYRVRARRDSDSKNSDYSNTDSTTTLSCPPLNAPSGLSATGASRTQIDLSWTNNSPGETTAFYIERSPDGVGGWTQTDSVPGNWTIYQNDGLACNTVHYYRVRAFRDEDGAYSAYSNVASALTNPCPVAMTHTVGLYQEGVWQFRDANSEGPADIIFAFGANEPGWRPLVGDWDGDGVDGIGLYKDGVWILRDSSDEGSFDNAFIFGPTEPGWQPVIGDWNGDDVDTIGLYRDGLWLLRNENSTGPHGIGFYFGAAEPGWTPIAGDWNANGVDTVGLYQNSIWYLHNSLTDVDRVPGFIFGPPRGEWIPVVGDWNEDGIDTIGLYGNGIWRLRNSNSDGPTDVGFNFGDDSGWQPVASYRGGVSGLMLLSIPPEVTPVPPTIEPTLIPTGTPGPEVTEEPTTIPPTATPVPEATEEPAATAIPPTDVPPTLEPTATPIPPTDTPTLIPTDTPIPEVTAEPET